MAPPAKRRRRNTLEASDDDDEHEHGHERERERERRPVINTLDSFLHSSPTAAASPPTTHAASASPSPTRFRSTRSQATTHQAPSGKHAGSPLRQTRRSQTLQFRNGAGASSSAKSKGAGKGAVAAGKDKDGQKDGARGSTSLRALFSRQAQLAGERGAAAALLDGPSHDGISSDDEIAEARAGRPSSSLVGQHARKRQRDSGATQPTTTTATTTTTTGGMGLSLSQSAGQRFLKLPRPNASASAAAAAPAREPQDEDSRPWSERFGPRNLEELAVHKKKVADVRRWLEDVMAGRLRQRLLVLKGAAGSGKTTTVRLLARDMGCEVLEWKNPAGNAGTGFVSASAHFDEFLGRGRKFGALDLEDPATAATGRSATTAGHQGRKIILIEEFPNTFSRASTALASFRKSILEYVGSHMPRLIAFRQQQQQQQQPGEPITPVVLVISETLLTTTSASADSLTAHRLLGAEILGHPGVGLIEFNAMAPTLLAKALELVVQKESRKTGRRRTPGPLVLRKLGEIGDIRSAISSLEFLCLKGDAEADWGGRVTFTRQKKGVRDGIGLTRGERESLEMVSRREASLGIFHAVGKVVYNKREEEEEEAAGEELLPVFLSHCARPKRSEVSVDALMDETGTDTHTFVSALHENYALSCESTDPMDLSTSVDYVNDCIDYLSLCDLLCPSRDVFFGGRGGGGRGGGGGGVGWIGADAASQLLRQDEMMFQVAVRGLLFALPNPVRRQSRAAGPQRGGDAFKMFYPAGLKLWRAREEIEGMVDVWTAKLLRGEATGTLEEPAPGAAMSASAGAKMFRRAAADPPASQQQQQQQQGASAGTQQHQVKGHHAARLREEENQNQNQDKNQNHALATLGDAGRREMLLDRLPYMAHIVRARKTRQVRDLEKTVSFQGVAVPGDGDDDEEEEEGDAGDGGGGGAGRGDGGAGESWATDKPSEEASPRRRAGIRAGGVTSMMAQKLVLSDDDIED